MSCFLARLQHHHQMFGGDDFPGGPRPETLSKLHTFIMSCGEENPPGPAVKNECMIGFATFNVSKIGALKYELYVSMPILGIYWNTCSHSQ